MIINNSMDGKSTTQKHRGINRAEVHDGNQIFIFESEVKRGDEKGTCVFISHRSTDKKEAAAIAGYIKDCGLDVYIDVDDKGLQLATAKDDAQGIVDFIHKGLLQSTHILVLISDDTRESWWVPYEIGYGEKSGKQIASMMLVQDKVDAFPDYLKIVKRLFSIADFFDYVKELKHQRNPYGEICESAYPTNHPDKTGILQYIKEVESD